MRVWQHTLLNEAGVGGVEKHIACVSAALRARGHEVHVGREPPEKWRRDEATPLIVHTRGGAWPGAALVRMVRAHPAARWIHVCHGTSVGRVLACREYFSLSGGRGSLRDFLPTHFADAAVAVSARALAEARRYFRMRLPAAVVANAADGAIFKPVTKLEQRPRLAFVGRGGDRVKNVPTLLEACERARVRFPGLELRAAPGLDDDGVSRPWLTNLGPLDSANLARELASCRALVLCSYY